MPEIPSKHIQRWSKENRHGFYADPNTHPWSGDQRDDHEKTVLPAASGECDFGGH